MSSEPERVDAANAGDAPWRAVALEIAEPWGSDASRLGASNDSAPRRADSEGRASLATWLAERGLAWIGGGALAIGGALLVGYAAQQGLFTPPMRLALALALGAAFIGLSEWVRRAGRSEAGNYPLVAALLAGAGAGTLYAVSWAAYALYPYLDWSLAAVALAACCVLLLGLSLMHGEALGVLAIAAAFLAPLLTGEGEWPPGALTLYLLLVGAAGFAVAAFKRWIWAAGATVVAAYAWFALALGDGAVIRPLVLLFLAAAGGCAFAFHPLPDEVSQEKRLEAAGLLATASIAASALFVLRYWAEIARFDDAMWIMAPALAGIALLALATLALRAGLIAPWALVAAIAALPLGFLTFVWSSQGAGGGHFYAWALASAAAVEAAGLAAALRARAERALITGAAALGGLGLTLIAALSQEWNSPLAWAPLALGALLTMLAAHITARHAENESSDIAVDCWTGAAAAAWLLALESAVGGEWKPLADAGAALLFAFMFALRSWRILESAALVAAAASLAHALSPAFAGAALAGLVDIWFALLVLGASAAALFVASFLPRKPGVTSPTAEAMSSAVVAALILGGFLLLRWIASGGAGARLDEYTENSLRALMLIAAGFVEIPRRARKVGLIARVRGHALLGAGLLFVAIAQVIDANPWWGLNPARIAGPPLINTNAVAFAAPALMALLVAGRLFDRARGLARVYGAVGAVFAGVWIALEIRHGFHGGESAEGGIGLAEAAAYAMAALLAAFTVAAGACVRDARVDGERPFAEDLLRVGQTLTICAVLASAFILCVAGNAWWGGHDWRASHDRETAVAVAAHGLALIACVALARVQPAGAHAARYVASAGAILFGLTFGLLATRWLHHGGAMDDGPPVQGLEPLGYALWPFLFLTLSALGVERLAKRESWSAAALSLGAILSALIWGGLAFAALALWVLWAPWQVLGSDGTWPAMGALTAHFAAAALSLVSTRLAVSRGSKVYVMAACAASCSFLLTSGALAIRYMHHDGFDAGAPLIGLEGLGYALWPLTLVAAGAAASQRAGARAAWFHTTRSLDAVLSGLIWPALLFALLGLGCIYAPWWGPVRAHVDTSLAAAIGLATYACAAALSLLSTRLAIVRENTRYVMLAKISAIALMFVAATLAVRRTFGESMEVGGANIEIWAYSGIWALLGAVVVSIGAIRRDAVFRWAGLVILLATTAKVFLFDTRDLEGVVRAASFLALGGVLLLVALASRRLGRASAAPAAPSSTEVEA